MEKQVTARDQLFFDLFVTALEGGIGYWSQCSAYHWTNDDGATYDLDGYRAMVIETEDEATPEYIIDRAVIAKGFGLATGEWRDRIAWSSGGKPPVVITDETDWDFDAGDADAVVQLGLFGDVVYG